MLRSLVSATIRRGWTCTRWQTAGVVASSSTSSSSSLVQLDPCSMRHASTAGLKSGAVVTKAKKASKGKKDPNPTKPKERKAAATKKAPATTPSASSDQLLFKPPAPHVAAMSSEELRSLVLSIFKEMLQYYTTQNDRFRTVGYGKAIKVLEGYTGPFNATAFIPGLAANSAARVREICQQGKLEELEQFKKDPLFNALKQIGQVTGFGPVAAKRMFEEFGVQTIDELRSRADTLPLTDAQRMGIKYFDDAQKKIPFNEILVHKVVLNKEILNEFGKNEVQIVVCGSHRRQKALSGDIDALMTFHESKWDALSKEKKKQDKKQNKSDKEATHHYHPGGENLSRYVQRLKDCSYIVDCFAEGSTKAMAYVKLPLVYGKESGLAKKESDLVVRRLDLRWVTPEQFPTAMLYFTGSGDFNGRMRSHALKQGYSLNEYGLYKLPRSVMEEKDMAKFKEGVHKATKDPSLRVEGLLTERDVFDKIGMPYVDPPNRVG